mgnify:FL=1
MILKSYIVEQNIEILRKYRATLIYGVNDGIKDDIKNQIKEQNNKNEVLNFFEDEIIKTNILYENTNNQSLFSEKKIVFIHEASDKILNQIEECLEKENDDVEIYILANNLDKKSKLRQLFEKNNKLAIFPCYEDNERTLISYTTSQLTNYKGITGEIINFIINNSSMNRRIIKNEIIKIKNCFPDKKVNKEQIVELLNIKNDSGFDEIRDKALLGEKFKINKLLSESEILNDEAYYYLNNLNFRIFCLQGIIRENEKIDNYEQTIENLKPKIFWKDKPIILQQLKKWNRKKLEKILMKIGETEVLMKKNSFLRNDIIIKDLIVKLTNEATASF